MAKRKARPMLMDAKYVWRRRVAALAVIGLTAFVAMLIYPLLDSVAEGACVTQLDNKSQWAVEYSRQLGEYPF